MGVQELVKLTRLKSSLEIQSVIYSKWKNPRDSNLVANGFYLPCKDDRKGNSRVCHPRLCPLDVMRIVVKNIQNLDERQVQKILSEWAPAKEDPACYYTVQDGVGSYYVNVAGDVLPALVADFTTKVQNQLGLGSSLHISPVQKLSVVSSGKNHGGGINDDPQFKEYLKAPTTWSLSSIQSKKKRVKKANSGVDSTTGFPPAKGKPQPSTGPDNPSKEPKVKDAQKSAPIESGDTHPAKSSQKKRKKKKAKPSPKSADSATESLPASGLTEKAPKSHASEIKPKDTAKTAPIDVGLDVASSHTAKAPKPKKKKTHKKAPREPPTQVK